MARERKMDDVLDVVELLLKESNDFNKITMSDVSTQMGWPRSTVINFIPNKETLCAYLAFRGFDTLFGYLDRANAYGGQSRMKFVLVYIGNLLFTRLHPYQYEAIFNFNTPANKSSVDAEIVQLFNQKMLKVVSYIEGVIHEGIFKEEITMPPRMTPFDVAYFIWAGQYGVSSLIALSQTNTIEAGKKYRYFVRQSLDAWPWNPISSAINYDEETETIAREYFIEELKLLNEAGLKLTY